MMRGDELGQDYGVIRNVDGQLYCETFGVNPSDRLDSALIRYSIHFKHEVTADDVWSNGPDILDHFVERFYYRGPKEAA